MITRRAFIAAMKKNGYTYNKKDLLHRDNFDGNSDIEVWIYVLKHYKADKEYTHISIQRKYMTPDDDTGDLVLQDFNYVPYDHVMLLLSLVKDMRKWWLA